MAELSKFQKFDLERVNRKTIKGASYNPRKISKHAKKKLQDNLKEVGLLGPVIVNRKTGNLVSGHQRLASLDALEGTDDYLLDVAFVSLSPKREREQNLFMNNAGAQGEWDIDALASMLPEIKLENTGFDTVELEIMFSGTEHESFFAPEKQPEKLNENLKSVADIIGQNAPPPKQETRELQESQEPQEPQVDREKSRKIREQMAQRDDKDDTNNFVVAVFPTPLDRDLFVERLGYEKTERYISGERLAGCLK